MLTLSPSWNKAVMQGETKLTFVIPWVKVTAPTCWGDNSKYCRSSEQPQVEWPAIKCVDVIARIAGN